MIHRVEDIRMREASETNEWTKEYWVRCTCGERYVAASAGRLARRYEQHRLDTIPEPDTLEGTTFLLGEPYA